MNAVRVCCQGNVETVVDKQTSLVAVREHAELNGKTVQLSPFKILLSELYGTDTAVKRRMDRVNKRAARSLMTIGNEIKTKVDQCLRGVLFALA